MFEERTSIRAGMAPAGNRQPTFELCEDPDLRGSMLQLECSRTAKSGFKGVTKTIGKSWQARSLVGGKLQHVHSSDCPRDCAIALARLAWCTRELMQTAAMENSSRSDALGMQALKLEVEEQALKSVRVFTKAGVGAYADDV